MGCELRGKFIATQDYLNKQEKHHINNLTLQLKQLEKEQKSPKVSRSKEIIEIMEEINEQEMKEIIAKIHKTKGCFFKKIHKIDETLARPIKKKWRRLKSIKLKGKVTIDDAETQRIMRLPPATICQ